MSDNQLISSHGGFRNLHSFQCAQKVYDGTVIFCNRFIDKKSRTHDQMVQAARSGVQNIAEGSLAPLLLRKLKLNLLRLPGPAWVNYYSIMKITCGIGISANGINPTLKL